MGTPSKINLEGCMEPTTEEKCKAILQKIIELINEGKPIGFEQDFGDWTATIINDREI